MTQMQRNLSEGNVMVDEINDEKVIILEITDERIDERVVDEMPPGEPDKTVWDYNKRHGKYSEDDISVIAIFCNTAEREYGDLTTDGLIELYEGDEVSSRFLYSFPSERLVTPNTNS